MSATVGIDGVDEFRTRMSGRFGIMPQWGRFQFSLRFDASSGCRDKRTPAGKLERGGVEAQVKQFFLRDQFGWCLMVDLTHMSASVVLDNDIRGVQPMTC